MGMRLFIIAVILFVASNCFAATAGNTSDTKIPYGPGVANMEASGLGPFKVSFDADWIFEKDLDGGDAVTEEEMEGQWYLFRIGYTIAERFEPYVKLGFSNLKAHWKERHYIKVKGENGFAVGGGGKVLLFEVPEHKIRFSLDGQYLFTDPDMDEVTATSPNRTVSNTEFQIQEWQVAGIVSMEFPLNYDRKDPASIYSVIPYIGGAYFDSKVDAKFTYEGQNYSIGGAENDDKFLLITGVDLTSPQNISLNVEGRWVGETAGSAGLTVKF